MNNVTVKEFVTKDFRAASVFERYGIDFCCGGGISLEEACAKRGVDVAELRTELDRACDAESGSVPRFDRWELDVLTEHIVATHHTFVKRAIPALLVHTGKVAAVHGERHPEVVEVYSMFQQVAEEMTSHMQKEELMLFPFIKALARSKRDGSPAPKGPFGSIANPIRMMEEEHTSAGGAMERIRDLTSGFQPPDDACTTYRVSFKELAQFERDLHTHVHLENNILFPRAIELEESLKGTVS